MRLGNRVRQFFVDKNLISIKYEYPQIFIIAEDNIIVRLSSKVIDILKLNNGINFIDRVCDKTIFDYFKKLNFIELVKVNNIEYYNVTKFGELYLQTKYSSYEPTQPIYDYIPRDVNNNHNRKANKNLER